MNSVIKRFECICRASECSSFQKYISWMSLIHSVEMGVLCRFSAIVRRESAFVTSRFLSCTLNPFGNGAAPNGSYTGYSCQEQILFLQRRPLLTWEARIFFNFFFTKLPLLQVYPLTLTFQTLHIQKYLAS